MIRRLVLAAVAAAATSGAALAQDDQGDGDAALDAAAREEAARQAMDESAPADLGLVAGTSAEDVDDGRPTDRVVVRGRRLDPLTLPELVREFVGEIAKPVSSSFGIARWSRRNDICVAAMNISEGAAQFVVDRVSEIVAETGLKPGKAGCDPDIYYIFTEDGRALATQLAEDQPRMFRPFGGAGGTTQGLHALEDFKNSEAPVRWWQITMVVDWGGNVAIALPNHGGGTPFIQGSNSRISSPTRDEIWRVYVIVDVTRMEGVGWPALADYLAVVSLAQIDPDADTSGFETVLNLFDAPRTTTGLTDWDLSYLRSLYRFDQHRVPRSQPSLLARTMTRDQRSAFEE